MTALSTAPVYKTGLTVGLEVQMLAPASTNMTSQLPPTFTSSPSSPSQGVVSPQEASSTDPRWKRPFTLRLVQNDPSSLLEHYRASSRFWHSAYVRLCEQVVRNIGASSPSSPLRLGDESSSLEQHRFSSRYWQNAYMRLYLQLQTPTDSEVRQTLSSSRLWYANPLKTIKNYKGIEPAWLR